MWGGGGGGMGALKIKTRKTNKLSGSHPGLLELKNSSKVIF